MCLKCFGELNEEEQDKICAQFSAKNLERLLEFQKESKDKLIASIEDLKE